jgi:hypothetical protein
MTTLISKISFIYCALHYLNQYNNEERPLYSKFHTPDKNMRRIQIINIATFFKVIRNLPCRYDEGKNLKRFEPIINILEELKDAPISSTIDGAKLIEEFANRIGKFYFAKPLSFASKVLWMEHRFPILIYDKNVRLAIKKMGFASGDNDIFQFYKSWEELFKINEKEIVIACERLKKLDNGQNNISQLVSTKWFQSRVFDIYLWFYASGNAPRPELIKLSEKL